MTSFSVLISIYYKEDPTWFRLALDSVFAQTVQPSEIVLVKDGPLSDDLEEVINEFERNYPIFKIEENVKNLGLGLSLRKGVPSWSVIRSIMRLSVDISYLRLSIATKRIMPPFVPLAKCLSSSSSEAVTISRPPILCTNATPILTL